MANYSIKDLERITGVKAHTIRIWEKRYSIVEPKRTDSNIRYYCDTDLKKLMNISILLRNGYKISRLAGLDSEELAHRLMEVSFVNGQGAQGEGLVVAMIELDELKFEKVLNSSIIKEGFENTIFNLIYPFFEKVGILWQAGSITPAHEHFITNLIKQKIYVAIDSLPSVSREKSKTFVVFLPEWEQHELGMLVYVYLLKSKGIKVVYLGQNLPEEDIKTVCDTTQPQCLLTSFSYPVEHEKLESYVLELSNEFPDKQIWISGYQSAYLADVLPRNVFLVTSGPEFLHKITEEH